MNLFKRISGVKQLDKPYNYYKAIKHKSNYLYEKFELYKYVNVIDETLFKIPLDDNMARELFYNYNLNLCNQVIYNFTYQLSQNDINFFVHFHIEDILNDLIDYFIVDIEKMKRIEYGN